MLGRVLSGLVKGFAKQRTLMSLLDLDTLQLGQAPPELALNSPASRRWPSRTAPMVRVLVARERLVPTDDPA